jgi:hypothetical protein
MIRSPRGQERKVFQRGTARSERYGAGNSACSKCLSSEAHTLVAGKIVRCTNSAPFEGSVG